MFSGMLVAIVGGWMLTQQPQSLVTQTELPPPGAGKATAARSADVPAPKPSASEAKKTAVAPSSEHIEKAPAGAEKSAPAKTKEEPAQAPAPEGGKPSGGSRVPAFWIVLPGK